MKAPNGPQRFLLSWLVMITLTNNAAGALGVILDNLTDFSDIELDYVIYRENLEQYGASLG